jgi:hypothetical protein
LTAEGVGLFSETPNNYRRVEDGTKMLELLAHYLVQVDPATRERGDVLALCDENCREPDKPKHLVIVSAVTSVTTYIIDATANGVLRHRMDGRWEKRVHSCWRVRDDG